MCTDLPMLTLERPSRLFQSSYVEALHEQLLTARDPYAIHYRLDHFEEYLQRVSELEQGKIAKATPQSIWWLIDTVGSMYLGEIHIRHVAHGRYPEIVSHIYYEIRPSARRRGYGTKILELGLEKARELGLEEVIVTCAVGNDGSRKIIERNRGMLIERVTVPGEPDVLKYRIKTVKENS